MVDVATFEDFYRAVNGGREPFPWQERLARAVVTTGWPAHIGVPTGLGKTACLDIAVWALAHLAASGRRAAPTRMWYVVNRRILVDAAWDHGLILARYLADPPSVPTGDGDTVRSVAEVLASLSAFGADHGPLHVARLRGGAELGSRSPDPSQPSLLFSTVPMFASRWLFRGYGSSRSMRPVDGAHAGIDSLVLLDEAHLSRPLVGLAGRVAECDAGDPSDVLGESRSRPQVVSLTATGEGGIERFDLDERDLAHPVVLRRLHAPKRGKLVETTAKALPDDLAAEALSVIDGSAGSCVVFVNTAVAAREVATAIEVATLRAKVATKVILVTGRMRDREGDRLRAFLLDDRTGVRSGLLREASEALVVVATQTLEVGADVDFDNLVTESAGVRSLVQRLGRVNRLGNRPPATCVICHAADRKSWPVYGNEPAEVWARLQAAARQEDLDLSPARVVVLMGEPSDQPPRVGELLPAHVWEWAKTTNPPLGEAPVELFFEGFENDGYVAVVWRAHRPNDGVRLVPPVMAAEAVDVPLGEMRALVAERVVRRLDGERSALETATAASLRPGDVLVLDTSDGFYDENGWNPGSAATVLDVSPLLSGALVLSRASLDNLAPGSFSVAEPLLGVLVEPPDDADLDEAEVSEALVDALRSCAPHAWLEPDEWSSFLDGLGSSSLARPIDDVPSIRPRAKARRRATVPARAEAFEELSFTAASSALHEHLGAVGEAAALIASRLGLSESLVEAVRLAGELHDLGKCDPRFQRWLDPSAESGVLLAKSHASPSEIVSARIAAGWPQGGRHELLSARLASSWLTGRSIDVDHELLLHLVASHHGEGRPLVRVVNDPAPTLVAADVAGTRVVVSGDLGQPDWDQPGRFRAVCARYGLWGVALLEAIVRQADHAVSHVSEIA
ncbi:MAG: type I-G CRISPR-associated helicase/endonuclease Cas3g [Acidimicrobiales bacterium]